MIWKTLSLFAVSWNVLEEVYIHLLRTLWSNNPHSFSDWRSEHTSRGSKQACTSPAKPSLLSSHFPREQISQVCRIYGPVRPCDQAPAAYDGVIGLCCWLFPTASKSMRECTLYLIQLPGGRPSPFPIICCLSATMELSLVWKFCPILCASRYGCTTNPMSQESVQPGWLLLLSRYVQHLVYLHLEW